MIDDQLLDSERRVRGGRSSAGSRSRGGGGEDEDGRASKRRRLASMLHGVAPEVVSLTRAGLKVISALLENDVIG